MEVSFSIHECNNLRSSLLYNESNFPHQFPPPYSTSFQSYSDIGQHLKWFPQSTNQQMQFQIYLSQIGNIFSIMYVSVKLELNV
ncbi:hypothetical protein ACH3XW_46385 [Acanthocheilonema viteae]